MGHIPLREGAAKWHRQVLALGGNFYEDISSCAFILTQKLQRRFFTCKSASGQAVIFHGRAGDLSVLWKGKALFV